MSGGSLELLTQQGDKNVVIHRFLFVYPCTSFSFYLSNLYLVIHVFLLVLLISWLVCSPLSCQNRSLDVKGIGRNYLLGVFDKTNRKLSLVVLSFHPAKDLSVSFPEKLKSPRKVFMSETKLALEKSPQEKFLCQKQNLHWRKVPKNSFFFCRTKLTSGKSLRKVPEKSFYVRNKTYCELSDSK